ncbi:MAG: hypothetical protein RLZZ165_942 [Bacteroidota bacterium]|jgi:hypothetical protein
MTVDDLHSKIIAAKNFLNSEMVRLRTNNETISAMGYRELGDRLDLIHEIERTGIRMLDDRALRRISRLLDQLEPFSGLQN